MSGIIDTVGSKSGVVGSDVYPAGHILACKNAVLAITGSVYVYTSSTTWVGTNAGLNITHEMENLNNHLIFTLSSGEPYIATGSGYYYVGIGKTTDLTGDDANIIRYGSDHARGRHFTYAALGNEMTGFTTVFKYSPGSTSSFTYQPIQRVNTAANSYMTNNSDACNLIFTLMEVKA